MDRRLNMIIGDVLRAALYLSIPLDLSLHFVNTLTWVYLVQFAASCVSLFWTPAKDASIPNLVPPDKLEQANQYSLFTTFGTAPIAGLVFTLLSLVSRALGNISHYFTTNPVNLALYFNAVTFVVSAVTIYALHEIPKRQFSAHISAPSVAKTIWEGWKFIGRTRWSAGWSSAWSARSPRAASWSGSASPTSSTRSTAATRAGASCSPRSRRAGRRHVPRPAHPARLQPRRPFGLSIAASAIPLALIALIPNLVVVVVLVVLLGACAGVAYVTGYTIVGREVDDDTRGRTFAFLYSAIRVVLFAVIAAAPFVAAGFTALVRGISGTGNLHIAHVSYQGIGYNLVLLLAAVIALWVGWLSYRQMDDRRGVPLREDLMSVARGEDFQPVPGHVNGHEPEPPAPRRGVFIALEGGEGAGKTTQTRLLAIWLRDQGYDVVTTREPGATKIGMRLRAVLLDTAHAGLSARAETLLYAADRAEHVATVICPALDRGSVVVTDRFVDSSLAYQGWGRRQPTGEVAELNRWATGGLVPDLTILLDLPPMGGLGRRRCGTCWRPAARFSTSGSARGSSAWPAPNPSATWCWTRPARPPN